MFYIPVLSAAGFCVEPLYVKASDPVDAMVKAQALRPAAESFGPAQLMSEVYVGIMGIKESQPLVHLSPMETQDANETFARWEADLRDCEP